MMKRINKVAAAAVERIDNLKLIRKTNSPMGNGLRTKRVRRNL